MMAFSRQGSERKHIMKMKYRLRIYEKNGDQVNIRRIKAKIENEKKEYDIK